MKTYLIALKKLATLKQIEKELEILKPKAVKEMRKEGFTYDQIKNLLRMGKTTVRRIDNVGGLTPLNVGSVLNKKKYRGKGRPRYTDYEDEVKKK